MPLLLFLLFAAVVVVVDTMAALKEDAFEMVSIQKKQINKEQIQMDISHEKLPFSRVWQFKVENDWRWTLRLDFVNKKRRKKMPKMNNWCKYDSNDLGYLRESKTYCQMYEMSCHDVPTSSIKA